MPFDGNDVQLPAAVQLLDKARMLLGENGECWGKHSYNDRGKRCVEGALRAALHETQRDTGDVGPFYHARRVLIGKMGMSITYWNDRPERKWEDVEKLFRDAREKLLQNGEIPRVSR